MYPPMQFRIPTTILPTKLFQRQISGFPTFSNLHQPFPSFPSLFSNLLENHGKPHKTRHLVQPPTLGPKLPHHVLWPQGFRSFTKVNNLRQASNSATWTNQRYAITITSYAYWHIAHRLLHVHLHLHMYIYIVHPNIHTDLDLICVCIYI